MAYSCFASYACTGLMREGSYPAKASQLTILSKNYRISKRNANELQIILIDILTILLMHFSTSPSVNATVGLNMPFIGGRLISIISNSMPSLLVVN